MLYILIILYDYGCELLGVFDSPEALKQSLRDIYSNLPDEYDMATPMFNENGVRLEYFESSVDGHAYEVFQVNRNTLTKGVQLYAE